MTTKYVSIITDANGTPTQIDQVGLTKAAANRRACGITDTAPRAINGDPMEHGAIMTERQARLFFSW